jgi:hypothetical protein
MYRPAWFDHAAQGRSVLGIASDVHSTSNGAMERSLDDQLRDLKLLRHVVENWKANTLKASAEFDTCVLRLILAALDEAQMADPLLFDKSKRELAEGIV